MEHIEVTDEWLYQHMPSVDAAMIQEIENSIDNSYKFSPKFRRRMKRLIHWERQSENMRIISAIGRHVAVIAFVILCSVMILTMSVEAYRVRFFETIRTMFDDYYILNYEADQGEGDVVTSKMNYVPGDYVLTEEHVSTISYIAIYENGAGEEIYLSQCLAEDTTMLLDSEYEREQIYDVRGSVLTVQEYEDGTKNAYYEYGKYVFTMSVDNLADEEIVSIIENLTIE